MKLAVATQGKLINEQFDKCQAFTLFEIEGNRVRGKMMIDASACRGEDALIYILENENIDVLLCNHIRDTIQKELEEIGMKIVPGITGDATVAVKKYIRTVSSNR